MLTDLDSELGKPKGGIDLHSKGEGNNFGGDVCVGKNVETVREVV